jgi:hypothetical protein
MATAFAGADAAGAPARPKIGALAMADAQRSGVASGANATDGGPNARHPQCASTNASAAPATAVAIHAAARHGHGSGAVRGFIASSSSRKAARAFAIMMRRVDHFAAPCRVRAARSRVP